MKARISVTGDLKEFAVALEGARKAVDRESLLQALEAGGAMVQESVQRQVSGKAKSHPRGQLSESITVQRSPTKDAEVTVGWETTPMRDKPSRRRNGPSRASGFTDVNGRYRKVTTVADYGRILEYSESRQLRHMEPGTDEVRDQAEKKVADIIDRKIAKALK